MQVTHFGRMGVALSAVLIATACGGGDSGADSLAGDTGAVRSASGDVAGSNMTSPAMVMSFVSTVNMAEVEAGRLGSTKATHAQVKQFAQMLVTEHGRADSMGHAGMTGMTGAAGATPGAGTGGTVSGSGGTGGAGTGGTLSGSGTAAGGQATADLQQMHQQAMRTLQDTPKGKAWDSTFVAVMVSGHQDVLARLEGMRGTAGSTGGTPAGTANPGAVASTGTTQPAGQLNQGDATQTHLQSAIDMVRKHHERAVELQRTLQAGTR